MNIDLRVEHIKIADLDVEIRFKSIKNLHLSVHPPYGKVTVSSPHFFDLEKVRIYLITKLAWIKKEQRKISSQDRESEKLFITRESHQFLGKRYLLRCVDFDKSKIVLHHNHIDLYTNGNALAADRKNVLYKWYRAELREKVALFVNVYSEMMQLENPEFGIRSMKTRWGSCIIQKRKLWFNIELAKKPIECIEYIVVHEMVHLLERNHNRNFILLMDRYLPNWRTHKKILNELPIDFKFVV